MEQGGHRAVLEGDRSPARVHEEPRTVLAHAWKSMKSAVTRRHRSHPVGLHQPGALLLRMQVAQGETLDLVRPVAEQPAEHAVRLQDAPGLRVGREDRVVGTLQETTVALHGGGQGGLLPLEIVHHPSDILGQLRHLPRTDDVRRPPRRSRREVAHERGDPQDRPRQIRAGPREQQQADQEDAERRHDAALQDGGVDGVQLAFLVDLQAQKTAQVVQVRVDPFEEKRGDQDHPPAMVHHAMLRLGGGRGGGRQGREVRVRDARGGAADPVSPAARQHGAVLADERDVHDGSLAAGLLDHLLHGRLRAEAHEALRGGQQLVREHVAVAHPFLGQELARSQRVVEEQEPGDEHRRDDEGETHKGRHRESSEATTHRRT